MERVRDVTGISGTGRVADGVEFPDGVGVVRWRGAIPSTVVWPDATGLERVHGHDGAAIIVWVAPEPVYHAAGSRMSDTTPGP